MDDADVQAFWQERHLCTLTTLRADGRPHVVPVGATLDPGAGLARIIAGRTSLKVRHVAAFGAAGAPVAVCQVDGRRWSTIEGMATIGTSSDEVAEACRRYAERYREPRPNPERIVILIKIDRIVGNV
ncbi:MAG TPA: TIGR03618 family F420-dependent PPOX class oxidoreductase [Sporichthya sp.]|nr:TIGR03618 family F420-dependent PPOX class oxidoreductase [Sporichthya sp.]